MTDFETHPAGTAARLAELEAGRVNPESVAGLVEALECSSRVIMQCPDAPYRDEQLAQNAAAIAALEQEKQS